MRHLAWGDPPRPMAQPGQVRLASPPDLLPERGESVVPGRGERADRDHDQARRRVSPPPWLTQTMAGAPGGRTWAEPSPGRSARSPGARTGSTSSALLSQGRLIFGWSIVRLPAPTHAEWRSASLPDHRPRGTKGTRRHGSGNYRQLPRA